MVGTESAVISRARQRFLAGDSVNELVQVVGIFAAYGVANALTRRMATIDVTEFTRPALLFGAVISNPILFVGMFVAAGIAAVRWPQRLWSPWHALEHGRTLRYLAASPVVILAWQGSMYDLNFALGRWHTADRLLILALAAGCFLRPVFLLPFAIESRVIAAQFGVEFQTTAAQNIDALLIMALIAIAVVHLWFVVTGRNRTAPVLLVLMAAIAAHFYIPGKSKLGLSWLTTDDISHLPLSAYTAGWLGGGDGGWAATLADALRPANRVLLAVTQIFELGAVIALVHHRMFRVWLPLAAVFHVLLFAMTGYWFLTWVVLELTLAVVLTVRRLQPWVAQNATPARAVITVAAVVLGGSALFHPPGLAWLDAPVSYGYRIEATGVSGARASVPVSAFAPFEQELAFTRLRLSSTEPVSAGYGALGSEAEYHDLRTVRSFEEIDAREAPADPALVLRSQQFMQRWLEQTNARGGPPWWTAFGPPDHFWTSSPSPTFDYSEPIRQLDVYLLTAIHDDDGTQETRRRLVLTLVAGSDGAVDVAFAETDDG